MNKKISIIIPTLGREKGLERCLNSIKNLDYPKELIETIVIEDNPRIGVPKRVNEGFRKSTGELIIFASNDIEFSPASIRLAVEKTNEYDLVAFNTGEVYPDEGNICEHFIIKKDFVLDKLNGRIFDEDFNHCGVDNLLWEQVKKYGKATRLDTAIVNHYHFTKGEPKDEVYKKGWEKVNEDREILKRKLAELNGYNPQENKIEGMMTDKELNWLFNKAKEFNSVVEIGSWMGRSTHALLSGCKGKVHSVDHFQGSADPIETGNKDVYSDFFKNVGQFENLVIHKKPSLEAVKEFEDKSIDMVFIDGGHQYQEVIDDIDAWKNKATKILCGHDINAKPVAKAVSEKLGKVEIEDRIWFLDLTHPLHQMAEKIKNNDNFSFVKMGDGEIMAMTGTEGKNCDGQEYTEKLQKELKEAYKLMAIKENVFITKWKLGMNEEIASLEKELGIKCSADHDLLLNRNFELTSYHFNFWKAIKESQRKKIFVGPKKLKGVVKFLNIDEFVEIPDKNAFDFKPKIKTEKNAIIIFSAGLAGKVWIGKLLNNNNDITCIDAGSSFDPIFIGQTRTNQVPTDFLRNFYQDLLNGERHKFSVVVIAKNEEKTLPHLLESVKGVDEVIVCDTGSTDKTIEVAKSYGAKVVEGDFKEVVSKEMAEAVNALPRKHGEPDILTEGEMAFNFAKARNFASSQARNDIIFMPDCDEVVDWNVEEVEKLWSDTERLEYNFIFAFDANGKPAIQFLHSKFYDRRKYHWVRNIHEVLVPMLYTNKVEGWMTDEELNFLYQASKQYKTIAEIGSWKGRSTNALLEGCQGVVTAIDHFEGSADVKDGTHGAKNVYEQFQENTKQFKNLKVVKAESGEAVEKLKDEVFEMVFIDGGHTYEEVKRDIELWQGKTTKLLCGHDYSNAWPEVKKAVNEKFGNVISVGSIWIKLIDGDLPDVNYRNKFTDKILLKHYQNPETDRRQYLKGLAIDNFQNEYNDRNAHYYARELYYRGWNKSAIEMFKKHIDNPGWHTEQGQSYIFMGNCYERLGDIKAARQCYLLSIELEPNRREAYLSLAGVYYNKKQWLEAERWYRMAISIPKSNYYANREENYGHFPLGQLAVCLFNLGKKEESLEFLKKALEIDPNNEIYKRNLTFY
jgi:glycosyltransferase involved in cell wall biosynthesis/tetratricopeptide (TPR) repeat protein/precorrin-6B methylase 2